MNPAPRFGQADLSNCDREPIRVPGSIQPHGALLAMQEPELTLVQVSANVETQLGRTPEALLFHAFDELLGPGRAAGFRQRYVGCANVADLNPVALEVPGPDGGTRVFDGVFHRSGGLLILEIEPAPARAPDHVETFAQRVRGSLRDLQQAGSVPELLQATAQRVQELTGFDRVMVYRFNPDWHGEVVAEALQDGLEPFLGLHYPASDIPKQARELYARNPLRLIPDATYVPTPLVPADNPVTGKPLDLGFSLLRSVSPIHLQYLRNMGVAASMSISLLEEGALWGLIACHHRTPRRLPYEVRAVCEFLGQVLSWQLSAKREAGDSQRRLAAQQLQAEFIESMSGSASLVEGLLRSEQKFLQFAGATGGAVCCDGVLRTVGAAPRPEEVRALLEWLAARGTEELWATDFLPGLHAPAVRYKDVASGLLAMTLSRPDRDCVLWFRPEILRTVRWGGDPNKPVVMTGDAQQLTPRTSFAAWKELVQLHSLPWDAAAVAGARDLRTAILAVIVRRGAELKRLNEELHQAVRSRDDFLSVASHELKTPLSTLQLQFHTLLKHPDSVQSLPADRLRAKLELSDRQVKRLSQLVDSLLDVTRVRAGKLELRLEDGVDLGGIVQEVVARLRPDENRGGAVIDARVAPDVKGRWDPQRLDQVVTNLLSNALKFGAGKPVTVVLNRNADAAQLEVRDQGIGITEEDQRRIFQRFERAVAEHDYAGLGLGLWITRQIVTRLGGQIRVRSAPGRGTTFSVVLPLAGSAA